MRLHNNTAAILTFALIPFAASSSQQKPIVPYDADLYHKDQEVVSTHGEFLYWTVQEGAIDFAQKMNHPAPAELAFGIGKIHSANYEIDPGIRFAVSYFNAPKFWEVRAQYTHLISRGKDRVGQPDLANEEYITGTWPQVLNNPLAHAHSAIEFNYNLFDLTVDRMFIPNPHLRLRMVAGLGAAWIQQDWKIHYFDTTLQQTTIRNRWHYVGAGLRSGLMTDWFWGNDVYLTGSVSMGIYMGSYHNRSKQTASILSNSISDTNFSDTRPAYSAQFLLGPSWQKNFTCYRMEIFAGYELNTWFNLQEIRRSTSNDPSGSKETILAAGSFAVHGLTTRFTFDF